MEGLLIAVISSLKFLSLQPEISLPIIKQNHCLDLKYLGSEAGDWDYSQAVQQMPSMCGRKSSAEDGKDAFFIICNLLFFYTSNFILSSTVKTELSFFLICGKSRQCIKTNNHSQSFSSV